VEEILTDIL